MTSPSGMNVARELWLRFETIHAVTYFGSETLDAGATVGLPGFWMAYFGFRAGPMGAVGSGVVDATFFNFAPTFVRRWVPQVWSVAAPQRLVDVRAEAAASTLRRVAPFVEATARAVDPGLWRAVEHGVSAGRPLFAANQHLERPDDPVEALWQLCTSLREHRGDGHVAALTVAGLDGLEAHVLISLDQGTAAEDLQKTRGWTAEDWSDAVDRLRRRGLVDTAGALTGAGRDLRAGIEALAGAGSGRRRPSARGTGSGRRRGGGVGRHPLPEPDRPAAGRLTAGGVIG
jgi:hypothetical protein